jgi:hypothetical protein
VTHLVLTFVQFQCHLAGERRRVSVGSPDESDRDIYYVRNYHLCQFGDAREYAEKICFGKPDPAELGKRVGRIDGLLRHGVDVPTESAPGPVPTSDTTARRMAARDRELLHGVVEAESGTLAAV